MGELRHIFNADINFGLKLKIYKTAVCSLLTYGSEAWSLDEATQAKINGANARMMSRFTNQDAHQEASPRTRTFDLVMSVRRRRFKWLGHILRLKGERLVKLAAKVQFDLDSEGGMFMDMPRDINVDFKEATTMAQDRHLWKNLSWCLGDVALMR